MKSTLVHFFTNRHVASINSSYGLDVKAAPCMVHALIVDDALRGKVIEGVKAQGGHDEPTALLSWDDIRQGEGKDAEYFPYFNARSYRVLDNTGLVSIDMDPVDAAALYGYSVAYTLQSRGDL